MNSRRQRQTGFGRSRRGGGRWLLLAVGVCLASLAFLVGASFFHVDEGPGYQRDCPVCNLERAAGSEPPSTPVALIGPVMAPIAAVIVQPVSTLSDTDQVDPAAPRGPPSTA